ncbi:MAG: hypothetical protein ACLFU8_15935 [Anaerolineales bacterium]
MPPSCDETLEKLRRQLHNQTPLIGPWQRRGATRALADRIVEHRLVPRILGSPNVEVLTALQVGDLQRVGRGSERSLPSLILACSDRDPILAERARLSQERTPFNQHAGRVEGVRILHNAYVAVTAL